MTLPLVSPDSIAPSPPLTRFARHCISAEAVCRDAQAKYDREQIEAKIAVAQAIPPSHTRYKEAQEAVAQHEDKLLLLRCAQSLGDMTEYLRMAMDYIVKQDDRLGLIENSIWLGAKVASSFPDKQSGASPRTAEAPLQSDSSTIAPTQQADRETPPPSKP